MDRPRSPAPRSLIVLAIAAASAWLPAHADAADTWRARVSVRLQAVYDSARGESPAPAAGTGSTGAQSIGPHRDATGRVQVDVHYDCSLQPPTGALTAAGLSINASVAVPPLCVIEGWIAPSALPRLASTPGVTRIAVPTYVLHRHPPPSGPPSAAPSPAVPSNPAPSGRERPRARAQPQGTAIDGTGVAIMRADQFVEQTRTSGAGVTVGVQSTGVASLSVIQQRGELPASVQVLTPAGQSTPDSGDEGTVLLEEVHAVAPSAGLAFCGPQTFVEYTACLGQLIGAGATILVDDVIFLAPDLMSADNTDTQAVEQVLSRNPSVALFTVVGNYNGSYWEGAYAPVSLASQNLPALDCPVGSGTQHDLYVASFNGSPSEQLSVSGAGDFPTAFAWGDPSDQNTSNFDVYWFSNSDPTQHGCFSTAGVQGNLISPSLSLAAGTYTLYIATPDSSLAGKFLKLWVGGDGLTFLSTSTSGAIVSAQALAPDAITIGAVDGSDGIGNTIETFSSLGPLRLLYPAPAPQPVQEPVLTAPDNVYVDAHGTAFQYMLFPGSLFEGTSASVPNAGAVAALLRGAFPELTVAQLSKALTSGAAQLGSAVPDETYGYGRIDAMGALATLPSPTITALPDTTIDAGASSPAYAFTVSGTGTLHFTVMSSNAALVPPQIVAAGSPGVTLAPASCGSGTMSCTLTVTAAAGAGGTTALTISAVDGANRSAPATMTVNVNGPPPSSAPPPAAIAAPPAPKGGGGALGAGGIAVLGVLAALRAAGIRRRREPLRR